MIPNPPAPIFGGDRQHQHGSPLSMLLAALAGHHNPIGITEGFAAGLNPVNRVERMAAELDPANRVEGVAAGLGGGNAGAGALYNFGPNGMGVGEGPHGSPGIHSFGPAGEVSPIGSAGQHYVPPIRRRPGLAQALQSFAPAGGSAAHPYQAA